MSTAATIDRSESTSPDRDLYVSGDTDVAAAARLLRDRRVRRLLVLDSRAPSQDRIVGTVSGHDIAVTVVAYERDPRAVLVADIVGSDDRAGS